MPSTKTIAVAVAALAASGVGASNCKPSPTTSTGISATTTSDASATTSACDNYELKTESEIETEGLNCDARGAFKDGNSYTIPSWTVYDCATSCFNYDQFACQLINFTPGEEPGIQGSCTLYPDNEITPAPRRGISGYYDKKCFRCSPSGGGRGGRGGSRGGSRRSYRGRV
ncbi:hypothetical protein FSST1_009802 [Fusarium sambucinum]